MSHVDDAINEMFQATHMQMMRNCCRLERMLLASVHMESRAKGQHNMQSFLFAVLPQQSGCFKTAQQLRGANSTKFECKQEGSVALHVIGCMSGMQMLCVCVCVASATLMFGYDLD